MAEVGHGPATIGHTRCGWSAMAMRNLGQSYCIVLVYRPGVAATLERHMQIPRISSAGPSFKSARIIGYREGDDFVRG